MILANVVKPWSGLRQRKDLTGWTAHATRATGWSKGPYVYRWKHGRSIVLSPEGRQEESLLISPEARQGGSVFYRQKHSGTPQVP